MTSCQVDKWRAGGYAWRASGTCGICTTGISVGCGSIRRKPNSPSTFFSFLKHSKGEWSGQRLALEPWQQFYAWTLFGWKRKDGTRRFRTSYLEVARKNGKSTFGAGVVLKLLVADGEPGAEIYTAATKLSQAQIVFAEAERMVRQSPDLKQVVKTFKNNLNVPASFAKAEPLGQDSDTLDGLNVHGALVDELHAHPTGDMWDVLETATGSRRQPLLVTITTAGHDRQTICYQFHDYTEKVLSQVLDDDAWHGMIFSLDRDPQTGELEDWESETAWIKANPNLGVSKKLSDMRDKARKAKQMPARLNVFLQKELNIWTQASQRWINPDMWRALNLGPIDLAELAGRPCYGGLDLSSTTDLSALVWVFAPQPGQLVTDVLCRFWMPEDNIERRVKQDRVPYDAWIRQGWITTTSGNTVDYDVILAQIQEDLAQFGVKQMAFDPWNATSVTNKLQQVSSVELVEFRQGYVSMNPAMKTLEVAVARRTINTGGNPVLAWMADNLVASMDPAGNLKPDKGKSRERIDGMVALIMALHRASLEMGDRRSVYDSRDMRSL